MWDLTSLVSWGDKCFLCGELGFTDLLISAQPNPLGTTEAYHSVPPISQQEKHFATYLYFWSSSTQWILSSTSITFLSMLCAVNRGSNPYTTNSRRPFLEIDVKGGERDHIKAYHLERSHQSLSLPKGERISLPQGEREISRGREYLRREYFSRIPDAWCSRGEMPHVFLRGKTCSYVLICISSVHLFLWALFFCSLSSPSIPC